MFIELNRRFSVRGFDEAGDLHLFVTDDQERAITMQNQMVQRLKNVTLTDGEAASEFTLIQG